MSFTITLTVDSTEFELYDDLLKIIMSLSNVIPVATIVDGAAPTPPAMLTSVAPPPPPPLPSVPVVDPTH